ncbi:MAG: hypothetical protein DRO99_02070 [Candidatus Aenigmatarchaeota archaeon]|nr:MAG: hypothetical protein DRO99_02070 [Candidatus Aenigmarchaeota archaeon]
MEHKTPKISRKHMVMANKLKGDMSYSEHYAYLLDWYVNDRNGFLNQAPTPSPKTPEIRMQPGVREEHFMESMRDVLDALKHLESKVSKGSTHNRKRAKGTGSIFTRLVDGRRFSKLA